IHFVNVICEEHENVLRRFELQESEVVKQRVCSTAVSFIGIHTDDLSTPIKIIEITDNRTRLTVGQHEDFSKIRVQTIPKREVDNVEFAAERNQRLGSPARERI